MILFGHVWTMYLYEIDAGYFRALTRAYNGIGSRAGNRKWRKTWRNCSSRLFYRSYCSAPSNHPLSARKTTKHACQAEAADTYSYNRIPISSAKNTSSNSSNGDTRSTGRTASQAFIPCTPLCILLVLASDHIRAFPLYTLPSVPGHGVKKQS